MPTKPEFVNSPELGTPKVPLSHAARAGGLIYLAGQIGVSPETGALVSGAITEQTRQVLENLSAVLGACGKTFGDVVKANVYLTDMDNFAAMNEVYKQYLSEPYPARTALAVKALPQGALVEIEMIAAE